ncbi:hypothetical protein GGX14DRAFT_468147 [Mycena pura]|uniref:Uncharacterized protein n=1 Tax=Mycena pura TaxID=153505 RepID=A0AAD6YAE0_9AGAR|nr:hypothetical protein GGX14DRAFT_468147 [Mycena pura]
MNSWNAGHVRHLDYDNSPHDSLGLLLRRIGLESLKVDALADECKFTSAESVLRRVPDGNRITTLVLTTSHDNWHFDSTNYIYKYNVERHKYRHYVGPYLERMVTVVPQYASKPGVQVPPLNRALVVQNIEHSMPRLTEMGIISVCFLRYIWNDDPTERRRHTDLY